MLVLAPTRELAVQIKEECDKFGASSQIKNTVVYGGVKKHTQVRALGAGVEIVIVRVACVRVAETKCILFNIAHTLLYFVFHQATPGRLIDHLEQNNTNLKRVTYLVLDEADRVSVRAVDGNN